MPADGVSESLRVQDSGCNLKLKYESFQNTYA